MSLSLIFLTALISFTPAHAAEDSGSHPCAADRKKFCGDLKQGDGAIMKCMKEHEAQLSAECKAMGEKMRGKMKAGREACKGDVEKFCKGKERGGGAILKCLKEHESELSAECKAAAPKGQNRE